MSRAVLLPSRVDALREASEGDEKPHYSSRSEPTGVPEPDTYAERLVKYIPAEAIGFFLLFSSTSGISDALLIIFTAVAVGGAVLWALNRSATLTQDARQPPVMVVIFTAIAFSAWALGTSIAIQALVGVDQQVGALVMTAVAFLLPAIDDHLSRALGKPPLGTN